MYLLGILQSDLQKVVVNLRVLQSDLKTFR